MRIKTVVKLCIDPDWGVVFSFSEASVVNRLQFYGQFVIVLTRHLRECQSIMTGENSDSELKSNVRASQVRPPQLSEEEITAIANQVAKSFKAKDWKVIANYLAKSLKPDHFWLIGKSLGKSPVFWLVVLAAIVSTCFTAWKSVPHFIKEKAATVWNQEVTNQVKLQFEEPRISNVVVAVASSQASNLMLNAISPEVTKFEKALGDKLEGIQSNLNVIRLGAETNINDLRATAEIYSLVISAQSDSREAFFKLFAISTNQNNSFRRLALYSAISVSEQVRHTVDFDNYFRFGDLSDPWKGCTNKAETASVQEYVNRLFYEPATHEDAKMLLKQFDKQTRFSLKERLGFLAFVIENTKSLNMLEQACRIMDKEAKLDRNFIRYNEFLDWYAKSCEQQAKDDKPASH